jgi:hypothetical protein
MSRVTSKSGNFHALSKNGFSRRIGESPQPRRGLCLDENTSCGSIKKWAELKITDIETCIGTLKRMKKALGRLVSACDGRSVVSRCSILEALDHPDETMVRMMQLIDQTKMRATDQASTVMARPRHESQLQFKSRHPPP